MTAGEAYTAALLAAVRAGERKDIAHWLASDAADRGGPRGSNTRERTSETRSMQVS